MAFIDANQLSSEKLLTAVQEIDRKHSQGSMLRRHDKVRRFLEIVQLGSSSLSTVISGAGFGVASLVQGGLKLVVDVWLHDLIDSQ